MNGPWITGDVEVQRCSQVRRIGPWYRLAVIVLKPIMLTLTRKNWRGAENLPQGRGFVVAVNHISHIDPFTFAHFMYDNGHLPRFLAKESVFKVFFIGSVMRGAQQIPVFRETKDAAESWTAAVDAVEAGECVVFYPEGTLTRDPELWPMRGKTGIARIALATGCPVIPVAQWGAQEILAGYSHRPHLLPRHDSYVWAGEPVDLDRYRGLPLTADVLKGATDQIMDDLTELVAEIRHEPPPAQRWDPQTMGQAVIGNPNAPRRKKKEKRR
jgi:1-acyl-sn-glycerol-3-phosphate acyltransferase